MKAASLYHLLQLRLRSLAPDCPQACRDELAELQAQLEVGHARGFFDLTWSHRGKAFSLSVADREFGFHIAGDTPLAAQRRGDVAATRMRNWRAAASLWQRMAAISGFTVPDEAFPPALAPPSERQQERVGAKALAGMSGAVVGAAIVALLAAGPNAAAAVALTAALLCCFAWTLDETHLRERLNLGGATVLAVGALLSLTLDWKDGGAIPLLAGSASAAWLERAGHRHLALWVGAGLLAGLTTVTFGWPGAAGAAFLAIGLLATAWAAPLKLSRPAALAFAGAALAAAVVLAALGFRAAPAGAGGSWREAVGWLVASGLTIPFLAWWIQGSLFHVVPWLGLGALSVAALAATSASGGAAGVLALGGLAALISWRLVRGFLRISGGR